MKNRLIFFSSFVIVSLFFSINSVAFDEVIEPPKRKACRPHCDDIEKIVIIYVGEEKYSEYSNMLADEIDGVASKKGSEYIKVPTVRLPVPKNWYAYSKTRVRVEFSVLDVSQDSKYLNVDLKMVTPAGVFSESSVCDRSDDESVSVCIESLIKKFLNEAIDDFLFDQGIAYRTR